MFWTVNESAAGLEPSSVLGESEVGSSVIVGVGAPCGFTTTSSKRVPDVGPPRLPLLRMIVATSPAEVNVPTFLTGAVWSICPDQPLGEAHVSFL